jgi:hypothetical protein
LIDNKLLRVETTIKNKSTLENLQPWNINTKRFTGYRFK